jgi:hypothetical protein
MNSPSVSMKAEESNNPDEVFITQEDKQRCFKLVLENKNRVQ